MTMEVTGIRACRKICAEALDGVTEVIDAATPWDQLARDASAGVYRLAYALTGNPHDAEDLAQDVFVRVFRYLSGYTPGNFDGWLHRITVNLFRDRLRRNQRLKIERLRDDAVDRYPGEEREIEDILASRDLDADIRAALSALHPAYRAAVLLYDVDNLSYDEIAAILGIKRGTVGSRIHRGHAQLRASLAHRAPRTHTNAHVASAQPT